MKEERQHADARRANKKRKITVMGVALLTSFITTFMGSALNLSIPSIDADFEAGSRQLGDYRLYAELYGTGDSFWIFCGQRQTKADFKAGHRDFYDRLDLGGLFFAYRSVDFVPRSAGRRRRDDL